MQHPFAQLAQEYSDEWATMEVRRVNDAMEAARRLLQGRAAYEAVGAATAVPAIWLMPTNEREDGGRLDRYFGNGDLLTQVTRDVPRGRGPFPPPDAWVHGCKDALHLDGIDQVRDWGIPRALFEWELWNGWGVRAHGRRSSYLWGGTSLQQPGKYVADGVWDPSHVDEQLGTAAIMWALMRIAPELALDHPPALVGYVPAPPIVPSAPPVTVGASHHDTRWLQAALNHVAPDMRPAIAELGGPEQIGVDGNYGRQTRLFVRAFEITEGLSVDRGFAGPQVLGKLNEVLGTSWNPPA